MNFLKSHTLDLPHPFLPLSWKPGQGRWLVRLLVIYYLLAVSPAGRRLSLIASILGALCNISHVWSSALHIPCFSQQFYSSCSSIHSGFCPSPLVPSKNGRKQNLGTEETKKIGKAPFYILLHLPRPMASKTQVKTFHLGGLHVHFIPRFLVQKVRHPGAPETSYFSKALFRKYMDLISPV